jgi:hypothetical protein
MLIIAKGQLRHHFWGDYRATIILQFATAALAAEALPQFPDWDIHSEAHPEALIYHGGGAELKHQEALLVSLGADRKKLGSLAKSIDFGEPFTVTVDLGPKGPEAEQLSLLED